MKGKIYIHSYIHLTKTCFVLIKIWPKIVKPGPIPSAK